MPALKSPIDAERMDMDDPVERLAFYEALIAHGATLVREERMKARQAGLLDDEGRVKDRSLLSEVNPTLSVEQ